MDHRNDGDRLDLGIGLAAAKLVNGAVPILRMKTAIHVKNKVARMLIKRRGAGVTHRVVPQ